MSKAFTPEDGGSEAAPLLTRRLQGGPVRPMTRAGFAALLAERTGLEQERARLQTSSDALEASLRRPEVERRLAAIDITLAEVKPVDPPSALGHAAFDTRVTLETPDGQQVRYHLVGPDEADVRAERLSVESPLARALLGRTLGETITVERPRGALEYQLRAIDRP